MYENQTFDTIIQRMLNNVDDDIDKREGSVIYTALAPIALELETYYEALDEVLTETFADTASYYYLAKRAAERNIYPIEATPSTLRMIADPPTAEIEVGDRFTSEDYELTFEVIGGDDVALSLKLPQGKVAYSFDAASVKSVDGYISEGDTVDVLVNKKDDSGNITTKIAYKDLKILRVSTNAENSSASQSGTKITKYSTLTVEVTKKQALKLYEIESEYDYKLILNPRR